jgi:sarcosine oxidase subunit beta
MAPEHVVVGGGIYGCGTAWELARRGADVTLLEADSIGSGASGGPGLRGVRANGRDPRELPLAARAHDLWPALADRIGAETGYERTGHLLLYEERDSPRSGVVGAAPRRWLQAENGVPTQVLDADDLRAREPHLSDDVVGALYCPNDGVADHGATTRGLAAAAEREGATVREGTPVAAVETGGGTATAVRTAGGERIEVGGTLALLANLGVPELVDEAFGVTLPVRRMLPQVLVTEPVDPVPANHLIGHDSRTLALKEVAGSRVMISGGWRGEWNPETGRGETRPEQVAGNVEEAAAVYPSLSGVGVAEADASRPESVSVDGVPIVDRVPDGGNTVVGTGWSGHGFAIAPAVCERLAEWIVGGARPAALEPFGRGRFAGPERAGTDDGR